MGQPRGLQLPQCNERASEVTRGGALPGLCGPLRCGRAGLGCHSWARSGLVWLVSVGRYSGWTGGMGRLLSLGCLGSPGREVCLVAVALLTGAGGGTQA